MFLLPLLFAIPVVAAQQQCNPGWTLFQGNCYKHFYDTSRRHSFTSAHEMCQSYGGTMSHVNSLQELNFIGNLASMSGWFGLSDLPIIGLNRNMYGEWFYNWNRKYTPHLKWCRGKPNNVCGDENCAVIVPDNFKQGSESRPKGDVCLDDVRCDGHHNAKGFSRTICKVPLKINCTLANTEAKNGQCVCKKDYIDITETDVPEKKNYYKGQKCIPKDPCRNVKDLTITYLVDSSDSIGAKNWEALVEFLRSGADFLPNTTRVGFVKFSSNVTFSKFLEPVWTKKTFRNYIPTDYEAGGTNTPAALKRARTMFKNDSNKKKVAVLITDGSPFDPEKFDTSDQINAATKRAAKSLHNDGVSLIALGYGEKLDHRQLRSWLEDPVEDYFEYDKLACDLKAVHMSILMRKVCGRYDNSD